MFPILPIFAWTGGIAAGCQVLGGVVRGTGELVRGRPGSALIEIADGCVAPLKTTCTEMSRLGKDVYDAILKPWNDEVEVVPQEAVQAQEPMPVRRAKRRNQGQPGEQTENLNGAVVTTEG